MGESEKSFHWADYLVFALTLAISCLVGLYYAFIGRKKASGEEFLLGNRTMKPLPTALSIVVSLLSSILILGAPAEMYVYGTQWWMYTIGIMLACIIAPLLFIPLLYPLRLTSSYEYLQLRFDSKAAMLVGSLMLIISQLFNIAISSYSPSTALEAVTGFPAWGSLLCVMLVAVFYTTLGGMRAVVWADTIQSVIMIGGLLAIVIVGCMEVGGIKEMWQINEDNDRVTFFDFDPDPTTRLSFWSLIIGGAITWSARLGVTQTTVQRFSAVPTQTQAYLTMMLAAPGIFTLLTLTCLSGMVIFARYADCDPLTKPGPDKIRNANQLVPYFVMNVLGWPGVPGVFLAVLFSATLSTVSSSLSAMAAVVWEDMLKWKLGYLSDKWQSLILKIIVVLFGGFSLALGFAVEKMGGIVLKAALSFISGAESPLLGLFVLGGLFSCANWVGAVVGGLCGLALPMWINIGAYVVKPYNPKLQVSIAGCETLSNDTATNLMSMINSTTTMLPSLLNNSTFLESTTVADVVREPITGFSQLYTVSFIWVPAIGTVTTVIVGLLVSLIASPFIATPKEINPKYMILIFDRWCCCLPNSWRRICRHNEVSPQQSEKEACDNYENNKKLDINGIYMSPDFINPSSAKTHL